MTHTSWPFAQRATPQQECESSVCVTTLADEAARRKRLEPMATLTSDGARKTAEAAKAGLPAGRPLVAPLMLVPVED